MWLSSRACISYDKSCMPTIVVSQTRFKILLFLQWIMFNYVHSPWSSTKLRLFTALHLQRCIMFNYWVLSFQNCISHKLREHFKMIKPLTLISPHSSSCSTESYNVQNHLSISECLLIKISYINHNHTFANKRAYEFK